MAEPILVDVDIALKVCSYRLAAAFIECTTLGQAPAILAISRYTLRSRLRVARNLENPEGIGEEIEDLMANVTLVQPTEEEIRLAADFEEEAIRHSLDFDTGESQLLAVLLRRGAPLLLTGDKRAIRAIHGLGISGTDGRIACLEQLMASILAKWDYTKLRQRVCGEPNADKAMTICFACSSPQVTEAGIRDGLASYVRDLRRSTATLLLLSSDLSAIFA